MSLKFLRKGLFYSLAGVYCAVCPLLVLYSLGYIYAPGSEHGIVKTGLIRIETTPPGAQVWLEGKRFTRKSPVSLEGLLPGEYHVTVWLKGHRAWKRLVRVRAEEAAVFDKVLLLPDEWKVKVLIDDEFKDLPLEMEDRDEAAQDPFPAGGLLAEQGITGSQLDETSGRLLVWGERRLGVLDSQGEELRWLVREARRIHQAFWVHEGSHVLYRDSKTLFLLNVQDPQASPQELMQVKRGSSVFYRERSGKLYFLQEGTGRFCELELVPKNAI